MTVSAPRLRPVTARAQAAEVALLFGALAERLAHEAAAVTAAHGHEDRAAPDRDLRRLNHTLGVAQALIRKADSTLAIAPQLDSDNQLLVARAKLGRAVCAAIEARTAPYHERRSQAVAR
jgi:hypothetical protein